MRLLVAGATGQIARSLLEMEKQTNELEMVALEAPELDLTDHSSIRQAVEDTSPDIIINAAAYTAVDKAEEDSELAIAVNRDGPALLAEQCNNRDIPLIHISTDYVYDGDKDTPYVETDPTNPLGVYGSSKLEGDLAIMEMTPKHIILRTAWVYSPFGGNFVKTMLRLAKDRDELNVVDDQRGSPSYAPHIAKGIIDIIANMKKDSFQKKPWGLYHLAGSGDTTWYDLAREVFAQSRRLGGPTATVNPITTEQYPTPARRPANSRLDCSKLRGVFGVTLPSWKEGVDDCVARFLDTDKSY